MTQLKHNRGALPVGLLNFTIQAAGMITMAFGLLALAGGGFGWLTLASFGANMIPMAPSTAVLFLLYGVAVCLHARTPLSDRAFRIGVAMGWLGMLVALLLFVLFWFGIHCGVEHFGMNITGKVGGAVIGHMSPITAFCFLLASVSFLASLSRTAPQPWRAALALGFASAMLGACLIFLLAYLFGTPLLYRSTFIPPALNTILAFITLSLALLSLALRPGVLFRKLSGYDSRPVFIFTLIFSLLSSVIISVGYYYYRHFERQFRTEIEQQLSSIMDLKVGGLVNWREDRMNDGLIFFKNPSFTAIVRRFFAQPADADAQRQLCDWLGKYSMLDDYDQVRLMDTQAVTRLSIPSGLNPASSNTVKAVGESLQSGKINIADFYRHEHNQRIYLSVQIPILDELDANRPLGVLVLRIDPEKYFYPFIQNWPTSSATAETLLVRRDRNDALYLNELRHQTNTALAWRIPLTQTSIPAVRAVLGETGLSEGLDYRGVPVIAISRTVPDSPWFMIAKVDTAEVYESLRAHFWQMIVLVGGLLLVAGFIMNLIWRKQNIQAYRREASGVEALRVTEERWKFAVEGTGDGVWDWNVPTSEVIFSRRWKEMLGFAENEIGSGLDEWSKRVHPEDLARTLADVQAHLDGTTPNYVSEHRMSCKDGSWKWILDRGLVVSRDAAGKPLRVIGTRSDITARKQSEQALQTEKQNLDAIFESSPVALFILDDTTNVTRINTAALSLTGGSAASALQHRPGEALRCVHASQDPRGCGYGPTCPFCPVRNGIESLLANGGKISGAELLLELMRNGVPEPVWVAFGAETIQLDGRRHLCVAMEDITARKQAAAINTSHLHLIDFAPTHSLDELLEETLNEAEKLSNSAIAFYHFVEADQVTLTLQNWSTQTKAKFCRAKGKGSHYAIDKAGVWVDCVHQRKPVIHNDYASLPHRKGMPEGHAAVIREMVVPVMQGEQVMAILGVGNKPGDYTPVDVAVISQLANLAWQIAIRKRGEELMLQSRKAALNLMKDAIEARDQSEQVGKALRESENRIRAITDSAQDAILMMDPEGLISYWNPAAERIFGYTAAEAIGKNLHTLIVPQRNLEANNTAFPVFKKTGQEDAFGKTLELEARRKDGGEISVQLSLSAINIKDAWHSVGIIRDITESKRAEAEKTSLELQLRESQKMEAVGQLAGGISHDFNNLLSIINGYSQVLLMNPDLTPIARSNIEEILKSGERAAGLTRQLLVFSRRQPMEQKILDLNEILSGVEKMLRRLIRENIAIVRGISADISQIKADAGNIEQVIMNLVINAGDAMPDGGTLTIKTENVRIGKDKQIELCPEIKPGAYVMFSVTDTGCGMDDKVMEHIFEPFFTTKEVGKGTGLGLATVYSIVKQSNAYIDVQSELGKGTKFQIYFPLVVDELVAFGEKQEKADAPHGTETILLVDDEDPLRNMLQSFLTSIGYTVIAARNGTEAIELARTHRKTIHVLLTDIVMPRMSGYDLAKSIKDLSPETVVLFMSGYSNPTGTYEIMKMGGNFIQKPVCIHTLSVKLREMLEGGN